MVVVFIQYQVVLVTALNYNTEADTDDGSCIATVKGCDDVEAINYNEAVNVDDGSCVYEEKEVITTSKVVNYEEDSTEKDDEAVAAGILTFFIAAAIPIIKILKKK